MLARWTTFDRSTTHETDRLARPLLMAVSLFRVIDQESHTLYVKAFQSLHDYMYNNNEILIKCESQSLAHCKKKKKKSI